MLRTDADGTGGRTARRTAVLLALVLAACGQRQPTGGPPGKAGGWGGPSGSRPVAVVTRRVTAQSFVERYTALGTARANESIAVTSRTSSIINRITFREGQNVRPGDLLVELDTRQERASLSLAEAQLQQAESQYRRSKALADTNAVSAADMDQLEATLLVARAQVRGARARLDLLYIRAPFAGTIGLRKVSPGDLVGTDTVITTLDDTVTIKLGFSIPEAFLADLRTGVTIEARSNVYPDRRITGTVTSIDSRVDPVTRSVAVIAAVANSDGLLKPGMFLTVMIEKRRDNVLMIPEEALVPKAGRQYVYVAAGCKALEREVELGGRAPGLAEIRSGLAAGDMVIIEGTQRVRDGAPVQVAADS